MKKLNNKALLVTIIAVFLISQSVVQAYVPQSEVVKVYTFSDVNTTERILPGTLVNFSIAIKNLTNNTIYNLTLFEPFAGSLQSDTVKLINSPVGPHDGVPVNFTSAQLSSNDLISGDPIKLNYLNITKSNFTMNFDELEKGRAVSFGYTLNITQEINYVPEAATLTYYDNWKDLQPVVASEINPNINVGFPADNPITEFFPDTNTDEEVNYSLLFTIIGITLIVAVFGRILYLKNPFKL